MWSNSVEERLQHMYLERDYLRVIDNAILNIEILNSRYHSNDFLRNSRNNRNFHRNRRNRTWNTWSSPNRNYIFSSGVTPPPAPPSVPPPPPPPPPPIRRPFSNSLSLYTRPPTRLPTTTTQTNTLNDNINNFINNTLYTPSRPDYPTFNQVSSATTIMNFSDLSNNNCTICPISRDTFEPNDIIIRINHCGHVFKKDSLLVWFETNSRCPVCRHDIRQRQSSTQPQSRISLPITNSTNNNVTGSTGATVNTTNPISSPINWNYPNSTDTSNLLSNIGRNFLNYDISNNDLDANLNNILTENLTNVLDNIGSSVFENLAGSVEQALSQTFYNDLSNNNLATTLEYTMEFPTGRLT